MVSSMLGSRLAPVCERFTGFGGLRQVRPRCAPRNDHGRRYLGDSGDFQAGTARRSLAAGADSGIPQRSAGNFLVVFAELAAFFVHAKDLNHRLESLAIELLPSSKVTLFEAGRVFSSYRQAGGVRTTMVPDFLIGAHAMTQAEQLASADVAT